MPDNTEAAYLEGVEAGGRAMLLAIGAGGLAVSKRMLAAAQAAYTGNPEYGLNDSDMTNAIRAAMREIGKPPSRNRTKP